ncbi:thiolase-like protein [Aspergillus transmontanensis]|uniref:Thiolase-like protein n=1 Tax=Aspergillus transmontanensis TaxID=1034304 RepID=A0A5N6W9V2_9EURO|nr:thiolase-like protein [Aspergillus transmontanensis]KAE8317432.1 thiolase-like protein [Aspergillus transmontanensis]
MIEPLPIEDVPKQSVSIVGIASRCAPHKLRADELEAIAHRHYSSTPSLEKMLEINRKTRIDHRYSVFSSDHEHWHRPTIPSFSECDSLFKEYGIPLASEASARAIQDWGGVADEITHVVAVTCTNTAHPGFDSVLCRELGLKSNVRRVLLHGIGCGGGISAMRVAHELLLGSTQQGVPARALIVGCEVPTVFARSELDIMDKAQDVNVAMCLFGDCAAALVLSNGIGRKASERRPIWNILNCEPTQFEGTEDIAHFDVHDKGYHAIIDKRIPQLTGKCVPKGFQSLIASTPSLALEEKNYVPSNYGWAVHPGGYAVLVAAQDALGLTADDLRASYDAYRDGGNTISTTIIRILEKLRNEDEHDSDKKNKLVLAAIGHGITLETAILTRPSSSNYLNV